MSEVSTDNSLRMSFEATDRLPAALPSGGWLFSSDKAASALSLPPQLKAAQGDCARIWATLPPAVESCHARFLPRKDSSAMATSSSDRDIHRIAVGFLVARGHERGEGERVLF